MFLSSNKLEQFEFKLEKLIGIQKHAGKVRKNLNHRNQTWLTYFSKVRKGVLHKCRIKMQLANANQNDTLEIIFNPLCRVSVNKIDLDLAIVSCNIQCHSDKNRFIAESDKKKLVSHDLRVCFSDCQKYLFCLDSAKILFEAVAYM